jgi:hypothetical protein
MVACFSKDPRPAASGADRLARALVRGGSLDGGRRHVDAVLREPRADGFLPAERLRIDQELVCDKDLSSTGADDQDARPLISARCREGSALELRVVVLDAYRCRLSFRRPVSREVLGASLTSFTEYRPGRQDSARCVAYLLNVRRPDSDRGHSYRHSWFPGDRTTEASRSTRGRGPAPCQAGA